MQVQSVRHDGLFKFTEDELAVQVQLARRVARRVRFAWNINATKFSFKTKTNGRCSDSSFLLLYSFCRWQVASFAETLMSEIGIACCRDPWVAGSTVTVTMTANCRTWGGSSKMHKLKSDLRVNTSSGIPFLDMLL